MLTAALKKTLILCTTIAIPAFAQQSAQRITLEIAGNKIDAELARTTEQRQRGLMHRESLGENQGMLFEFPQADYYCMWMKNTLIPLSIAFIDEEGRIINIEEMQEQSEQTTCAKNKARYALEMNRAWFSQHQINNGQAFGNLPPNNLLK